MKFVKLEGANTGRALFVNAKKVNVVKREITADGSEYTVLVTDNGSNRVKGSLLEVATALVDSRMVQLTLRESGEHFYVNPNKVTIVNSEPIPGDDTKLQTVVNTNKGKYPVTGSLSDTIKALQNTGITE